MGRRVIPPGSEVEYQTETQNGRVKAKDVTVTKFAADSGGGGGGGGGKDWGKGFFDKGKGKDGKGKSPWDAWWDPWSWKGGKGKWGWDEWDESWGKGTKRPGEDDDGGKAKAQKSDSEPTSVPEWIQAQDRLFGHLSKLPTNWIRIRSKSSGKVYLYNSKTGESKEGDSFDEPPKGLPPNWQELRSKSTGQVYYYNSKTGQSQFDEPTN